MPAESKIETDVCRFVERELGGIAYKFTSPGRRGVPDRLIVLPDLAPIFVEFKAPKKKPTSQQVREHKRLRDLGCTVLIIDNPKSGKEMLHAFASLT